MTYTACVECKKPFTDANVHTKDGWFETQISGMCENCFDAACKEFELSEPGHNDGRVNRKGRKPMSKEHDSAALPAEPEIRNLDGNIIPWRMITHEAVEKYIDDLRAQLSRQQKEHDSAAYILCLDCRGTFTTEQCSGGWGCPKCGSKSVPADTRKKATLTFTHHEWRILFMWADNFAQQAAKAGPVDESAVARVVPSLVREARRQAPGLPGLTMGEDMQEVANIFGKVEMHAGDDVKVIEPEQKH